ncbi:MAG: DUF421 domain-containing protein [Bacillota bacterium]
MIPIFIRTIIIFSTLFVVIRLMGKRQIGEMQPLELVVTLVISDLACIPLADVSIPIAYGVVAILAVFFVNCFANLISSKSINFRMFMTGKPTIIIDENGLDEINLRKLNMNINDVMESIRTAGYFHLDDIKYAIFETNGKLSVVENSNQERSTTLPLTIVGNGMKMERTLDTIDGWEILEVILKKHNIKLREIVVMTIDDNGKVYLKEKGRKYRIINTNFKIKGQDNE